MNQLFSDFTQFGDATSVGSEDALMFNMLENAPINIMFADRNRVIRYMNPASRQTLESLSQYLPIPVEKIVGASIDLFHRNPEHQKRILNDPSRLPRRKIFDIGDQVLDLLVSPIYNQEGEYIGGMATWKVVTDEAAMRNHAREAAECISTGIEQIAASMSSVASNTRLTQRLAEQTKEQVREASEKLNALDKRGKDIAKIVAMIDEIADETKLLSLNATIEAARAGEAGKGFSVVASAVKDLARNTRTRTAKIQSEIDSIGTQINELMHSNVEFVESVEEVRGSAADIANTVAQQSDAINELSRVATQLNADASISD